MGVPTVPFFPACRHHQPGWAVMEECHLRCGQIIGVCECHRTRILNRGSGGRGQPGVGFI